MTRGPIALVAVLAVLAVLAAGAPVAARPSPAPIRCGAPPLAQTQGAIQLLRARGASCAMARRIAVAWDALCRSESEPVCVLRTRRTWRCTRGAATETGAAVRCRSGRLLVTFFWGP